MKKRPLSKYQKEILSDPVAAFCTLDGHKDENIREAIYALWQQAQSLQQQHRNVKLLAKTLSRQIGATKRENRPVDDLKASMQEKSKTLKQLENKINDIDNRILHFFGSGPEIAATDEAKSEQPGKEPFSIRNYNMSAEKNEGISVSLMNDEHEQWNNYVTNNPAATIYHRAEWQDLFQCVYGLESAYFVAHNAHGQVAGVLPLMRLRSRLFGDFLISMPYFSRGGAVADHPVIEQELIHAANKHAAALGVTHIEYRDDIQREGLPAQTHKVNMVLELPDSEEDLWRGFSSKLRAQIRRPQREKPRVYLGKSEYLSDFYAVYARNMRDLGSPAHSKKLIRNILERFPDNSWIILLRQHNIPVSAGLLLKHGRSMEIPLASTIRSANPLGMNMLMYWEVLKFSIQNNCDQFDFGRSSRNSGTFRFKQQWGARPKQLYIHYWLNKGIEIPSLNPSNPKYALLINTWKRLPVSLTRWIGPPIVKNLP